MEKKYRPEMRMTRKNVIIIVIDALRTDRLGCYGYKRMLTPNIDEIANKGVIFENCFSTFNATDPAFTTIVTGLFPASHRIRNHADRISPEMLQQFNDNSIPLISEILHKHGYATIGLDWLGRWHKRGYDYYLGEKFDTNIPKATFLTDEAIAQINNRNTPFFLFIHYWDSHTPYQPPEQIYEKNQLHNGILKIPKIFDKISNVNWKQYLVESAGSATTAEEVIAAYDSAVQYIDQEIGRLIESLKENNLFDNTIIIITSDHGESLTEHEIFFDHHGLYDESIHVPLIFGNLPWQTRKIKDLVQHPDIVPTVFDLLEIAYEQELIDGKSLVPVLSEGKHNPCLFVISEESWTEKKIAIRSIEWKYIMARSSEDAICRYCGYVHEGVEELYDLIADPHETLNCISMHPEIAKTYRDLLAEWETMMKKRQGQRRIRKKIADMRLKIGHRFQ